MSDLTQTTEDERLREAYNWLVREWCKGNLMNHSEIISELYARVKGIHPIAAFWGHVYRGRGYL